MKMWTLQNLLFTLCIALNDVTSAAALIHVSGYEGREAEVSCPYEEKYKSVEKYLCRNTCSDILIRTTDGRTSRYSIYDDKNKRVFTVSISGLRSTDAGTYWCGFDVFLFDTYTEVKLDVRPDRCCDHFTQVQGHEDGLVSISCPYESEHRNNLKYICRGKQPSTCLQGAVIASDRKQNGRFSIDDDKTSNQFTVTITSLTRKDSGFYLCGVRRHTGLDVFSSVELQVKEWCCVNTHNLSSIMRLPVTIECPYPSQHRTNRKFLCKGDHRNNCTAMVSSHSSSKQTDHRFTLQDDAASSLFLVTITELEADDAGTYWCGSDLQWSVGNYTKIQLSVDFPQQKSTVKPFSRKPAKGLFYTVIIMVPIVLLVLISALVVVYKYKYCNVQGSSVNRNSKTAEEVTDETNVYGNQEMIVSSKSRISEQQSTLHHGDEDGGQDQQDSLYQNFMSPVIK